jgi:hypothetical protein
MQTNKKKLRRIGLSSASSHSSILSEQKRLGDSVSFAPLRVTGAPFSYHAPSLHLNGPPLPAWQDLAGLGYLQHMRAASESRLAGGFVTETGCARALFEARVDIFVL